MAHCRDICAVSRGLLTAELRYPDFLAFKPRRGNCFERLAHLGAGNCRQGVMVMEGYAANLAGRERRVVGAASLERRGEPSDSGGR